MKHLKTLITLFLLVIGASVSWAQSEETSVPARTAIWNWKNGVPSSIFEETNLENAKGYVHSEDDPASLKLEVDATGGSFTVVKSGKVYYAKLTNNCKIKVPVRRAEDKVTITCQSKYNYKIGTEQDRTFDNIGDFYIANDTDKIYRYIQDLYETKKENFKVNAEFMYNTALLNNGCRVMPDGKVARMTSAGNYDEDFCILPSSFDGTYEWIPDVNYGTDTGGMADVIGNSIYIGGAIDNINVGGGIL